MLASRGISSSGKDAVRLGILTLGRRGQAGWKEHGVFIDRLSDDGKVLRGGPVGEVDGQHVVPVVQAGSEAEAPALFRRRPWTDSILRIESVDSGTLRSAPTTSRRPDAAHKTAVIDPATLSIGPVLTLAEAKSGALLDRLEVVTRRDLTDDVRGEGSSLGRLAEIPHVILPPRRGVEVEEANRPVARVAEGVGHAGRHADERAGAGGSGGRVYGQRGRVQQYGGSEGTDSSGSPGERGFG